MPRSLNNFNKKSCLQRCSFFIKIDNQDKSCDISLITDTKIEPLLAPYAGLEAMALMSDYAFSKLKLKRIDCAFTLVQKVGNKGQNS